MIKNEHQLKISQQRLKEFRQAFLELKKQHSRPEDFEFYSLGVREYIKQIEKEIINYQNKIMDIESDRERLAQKHNLEWLRGNLKAAGMVTVDLLEKRDSHERCIYCALILPDQVEQELSKTINDHDTYLSDGLPSSMIDDESQVKYLRYGVDNGFEPLIINRYFRGVKEAYKEICEEFRHFHNLYSPSDNGTLGEYIKIDNAGNEEVVAIVEPKRVQIRLKEIRQFLAIKEMYLLIRFDFSEYSVYSLEELGLSEGKFSPGKPDSQDEFKRDNRIPMSWTHAYRDDVPQGYSLGWLTGRQIIKPLPKSKSGFGDFAEEPAYAEFIVDVDENGDDICHACDPNKWNDYHGENPDAPFFLTPVHFHKQVLDKYYNEPSKYTVEDSSISCASLWSMKIDNHDPDKVCVLLRELPNLPYKEQLHWRLHNIQPEGGVSNTFFRRNFKGLWVDSDQPDLLFKQSYHELQRTCDEYLGWRLLKPLSSGDEHRLKRLRIPSTDEESHFKEFVSDLSCLLIDKSLNEKCLKDLMPDALRKKIQGGINRLEYVLTSRGVTGAEQHIVFLRCLWDLRCTRSSPHPEILDDNKYNRAAVHFNLENLDRRDALVKILEEAVEFLGFLTSIVRNGQLNDKNDGDC